MRKGFKRSGILPGQDTGADALGEMVDDLWAVHDKFSNLPSRPEIDDAQSRKIHQGRDRPRARDRGFPPAPDDLVLRDDNVEVTLSLSRRSLDFFKRAAKARHVPNQRMIRALVDQCAEKQGKKG